MKKIISLLALAIFVGFSSCRDDDEPEGPNDYVNNWIYSTMETWYYWNEELPDNPDKSPAPDVFFKSLLNTEDRFSWIQENYQELLNSLQGVNKEGGYELALFRESVDSDNLIAQIVYTKPGSPAEAAGLKRGDIISKINAQQLTINNYQALLRTTNESHTLTYRPLDQTTRTLGAEQTLTLTTIVYAENPNFMHHVFTYGDRKIGYYIYNLFSTGATSTSVEYNNGMDAIFAEFKAAGITDLIVDLRFNSGGAETATNNLASLIGKGVNSTKVFTRREYNTLITNEIINDPTLGEGFLTAKFLNKTSNIGNQLRDSRVYILTGTRTASASELLVNGLKPYMDVFLVGSVTVGKNVGSITLRQQNDPRNEWGMQPIVVKSFNSLDQSDYSRGFNPQILLADNNLILYPLGDPREKLLNRTLQEITGLTDVGRVGASTELGQEMGHSLELKKHTNTLIIDPAVQQSLKALQ